MPWNPKLGQKALMCAHRLMRCAALMTTKKVWNLLVRCIYDETAVPTMNGADECGWLSNAY